MPEDDGDALTERGNLRRQLAQSLAVADDERFLNMVWAARAIQSGRAEEGLPFISGVPDAAVAEGITNRLAIYPWELETLTNELLAQPKHRYYRVLQCGAWNTIATLTNQLRDLEGAEYVARRGAVPILREMYRIQGRQFEWQRGFPSVAQFYRNCFIYGQGACAEYFQETHDISIAQLTLVGYALFASFLADPTYDRRQDLAIIGVTPETRERAMSRICAPISTVRDIALRNREGDNDTAYRPSALRLFPCIAMDKRLRRIRAPIPELVISRVTSGLFYDVVGGGGPVRDEYGRRFEQYVHSYFEAMLPAVRLLPEWHYRVACQSILSPDLMILGQRTEEVSIAVECKATRMSIDARFGELPENERGYEDMEKAVFQIWRFFSHCRRGLTGRRVAADAVGIVLTLENWFVMGSVLQEEIEARAVLRAQRLDSKITDEDRRRVIFCPMPDLEEVLATATEDSFRTSVARSVMDDRRGWLFSSIHREVRDANAIAKAYPFAEKLAELLPWWERLERERGQHGDGTR